MKKAILMSIILAMVLSVIPASVHASTNTGAGSFLTLLFSRTEVNAADNCQPDSDNIASLTNDVAPYLQSMGYTATGTLVTNNTYDTTNNCTHWGDSLTASWADATNLAANYGWSFVSHTADYPGPAKMAKLTPLQQWQETCGSAQTITDHNLPGANGMVAYPGKQAVQTSIQTAYGQNCFAWGREYDKTGTTSSATSPYWQNTMAVIGGPCNDKTAACSHITATGTQKYRTPQQVINQIAALQPGQWYTLQAYVLVNGTNPAYTTNTQQWDCTSSDPNEHWTNDAERYCYSDYQTIIQWVHDNMPGITVTDPLTVGIAFGRPATYDFPPPSK